MAGEHQSMNSMIEFNADEEFYKEYYIAGKDPRTLKEFLSGVDLDDAVRRHLVIPELLPDIISYEMNDDEYFHDGDGINVIISKHNRYTPAFMHRHSFFEIIFVFMGQCTQTIGIERKQFREGDIIFIAPKVYHTMEVFDDDTVVLNILLRKSTFYQMFASLMKGNDIISKFFSEGLYDTQQIKYLVFHEGEKDLIAVQQIMMQMYKEQLYHDQFSDQILIGMITVYIGMMMRNDQNLMESSFNTNEQNKQLDFQVMSYIQKHLADVTLNDIADHFGFSVSYCSKLIKANTGQGFNEWKRALRIREAEQLLTGTKKPVTEISSLLGYENVETFIRAFKKELHITPASYRKHQSVSRSE